MTRKIKAKANAMVDADVNFISLVTRPASRIPFRLTKSDDDSEAGFMIHLKQMFKRDGAAPQGCTLVGVVLQKQHEDALTPQIKELGLKIDDRSEKDDVVILKQLDYDEDQITAIKLGEVGGLFVNVPEQVTKAFDPFTSSDDFDENMALGFIPGMSMATEALMDTVIQVLRTSESPEDAKGRIETNIDKYKAAVLDLADNLPVVAFKLEGLTIKDEGGETAAADAAADAGNADDAGEASATDQAAADAGDPADAEPVVADADADADAGAAADADAGDADAGDAAGDADAGGDAGDADAGAAPALDPEAGLSEAEKQALKGVHIEDLDVVAPAAAAAADAGDAGSDGGDADASAQVDKSKSSEQMDALAGILTAFKSEVLEAISSVKSEVSDLKSKHAETTEKLNTVAAIAERAQKAVKGTVPSNSDVDDHVQDESLGTRTRNKGESTDEKTWGGTALDRIVGDFGTGE